jgi:hypothetical protein
MADNQGMRTRTVLLVLFALALAAPRADAQFAARDPAPGEDFAFEISAIFWSPTPEMKVQTGALAAIGETEVDFVKEFGIEKKRFREIRAVLKAGRKHKLRFNYIPIEYHQETTLARTITFGGRTFTVGLPAQGDLSWKMWTFAYEWDMVAADRGFFGVIIEGRKNEVLASLNSPVSGLEATETKLWVPALGVIGRAYPSRNFSITAEFTGFKVPDFATEKFEAKLYDFDIYGTVNFGKNVGVHGGYRSLLAEYLQTDDAGRMRLKGMYFGGSLRF